MNRDVIIEAMRRAAEFGVALPGGVGASDVDEVTSAKIQERAAAPDFGKPESALTHRVDVSGYLDAKRASMLAHESQIAPDHFLVSMPSEAFAFSFGAEWFIVDDVPVEPPAIFAELFTPKSGPA